MRSRPVLTGPRGWGVVGALATALVGTVAVQLPAAAEGPRPAAAVVPVAAVAPVAAVVPVAAPSPLEVAPAREARAASVAVRRAVAREAVQAAAAAARRTAVRDAARTAAAASACSGPGWQQRRGAAALASLRPAAMPASALRFRPARSGFLGLTHLDSRLVEVFVRPCSAQSDALLRHVVAHELGHAHDLARLTPALRASWMRTRGIPASTPWFGCDRCTDFATPAGDFAETYAQWRRGSATSRSRMASAPGPAALERLAATFFAR